MSGLQRLERVVRISAIASLAAVFWLSLAPDPLPVAIRPIFSALSHVVMHFFLASFFLIGWSEQSRPTVIGLAIVAIGTELLQVIVPNRTVELLDLVGNLAGLGLGYAFFASLRRFVRTVV